MYDTDTHIHVHAGFHTEISVGWQSKARVWGVVLPQMLNGICIIEQLEFLEIFLSP